MTVNSVCPKCGKALPPDSPGRCPECVLGLLDEVTRLETAPNGANFPVSPRIDPGPSEAAPATFGDYELIAEIARGGMGVVYKARQRSLNRIVAVKVILAGRFAGKQLIQRFRGEVTAAAVLQHPNIVAVHEVGFHEGQHFFSMNFIEGQNLAELVGNRPLSAERAARYLRQIAEAIHYAHSQGILHRDLKPSNVLIESATDQPRVTDFGLAKQLDGESSLTVTGQVLGSPNFMPPEQASGNRGKVGRASDVYGLGAILFYLLTARAPFQADSLEGIVTEVLNTEAVSPKLLSPQVPADLETICLKCLEKEPARRYQTAQELADELGRFLDDEPILARPVSRAERLWRWCRRKPALAGLSAVIVLLVLLFAVGAPIALLLINQERRRAENESALRRVQLYATEVDLAGAALANDDVNQARSLLMRQWPAAGSTNDLRGFEWRYLYGQCGSDESATLGHHEHPVQAVAFSPVNTLLASWEGDGTVKLWDYQTQKLVTLLRVSKADAGALGFGSPSALAFSPNGQLLAAGCGQDIYLWDVATQKRTGMLPQSGVVSFLAFTRDGKTLVSTGQDGFIYLWDAAAGNRSEPVSFRSEIGQVWRLAISSDDKILAGCGPSPTVGTWDISDRKKPFPLPLPEEHLAWVTTIAFAAQTNLLVSAGTGGDIIAWHLKENGELLSRRRLPLPAGGIGPVNALLFAADPNRLISAGADDNITVWDLSGKEPAIRLKGHRKAITALAVTADGRTVASGGMDGSVKLWDIASAWQKKHAPPAMSHGRWALAVAFSPDGKLLASVASKQAIKLWDTETEKLLIEIETGATEADRLTFSPDGKFLATEELGKIHIRRVPSLEVKETVTGSRPLFSSDGSELIYFSKEAQQGGVHRRNLTTGKERVWATEWNYPAVLALSGDGRLVAGSSDNGIWMAVGEATSCHWVELGQHRAWSLAFAPPAGRFLASAGGDGAVRVWDLTSSHELTSPLTPLTPHHGRAWAVAFSPDGRTLATGGDDGAVHLWNFPSLQEAAILRGHTGPVDGLTFSSDGNQLASCSGDGTARIWRAPSLKEIAEEQRARDDGKSFALRSSGLR